MNLIKKIWDDKDQIEGSGIKKYSDNKIEYRYIDDLTKLDGIINYIYAQEKAGNNNFLNEKKAIKDFISNKLDELIEKPDGIKYLKRMLPAISSPIMKEGSGLLNDFINNLPFELHVPGYQYLGPGTKLDKRLKRGDPGINPLDKAAMEHDKYYAKHKDTNSRHIADKILQDKAVERILSKDASLGERFIAVPTAGAMFLKRKLGMGIEENLKF
uniref:Phospholipase A2-like domain-containing protein n=1 Tax=Graphocephala atropunctata TaxID=36148 RepID=A0A1B6KAY5_9HEMI